MSLGTAPQRAPRRSPLEIGGALVFGVIILALAWLFFNSDKGELRRSATGFDGLIQWLRHHDVEARVFDGGGLLVRGEVGLRLLPLFDTDLSSDRVPPEDIEEMLGQTSERDLDMRIVRQKYADLPTIVVLPKWRTGMRQTKHAHWTLLIPEFDMARLVRQVGLGSVQIHRDRRGLVEGFDGTFMHVQTLSGTRCKPIIGNAENLLFGRCPVPRSSNDKDAQTHFWILADPDLLNNHGLRLPGNADLALELTRGFDLTKPVLIDMTDGDHTVPAEWFREQRERTWGDVARIFRWPFAMIWIAFGALGALMLWRAVVRDGPVIEDADASPRAAKEVSIDAKARLLRLADHDVALLRDHIGARLQGLAAEILGPHAGRNGSPAERIGKVVRRHDPALADELQEVALLPPDLDRDSAILHLERFEDCYAKVKHGFGRPTSAG